MKMQLEEYEFLMKQQKIWSLRSAIDGTFKTRHCSKEKKWIKKWIKEWIKELRTMD